MSSNVEIERKYIIRMPDVDVLRAAESHTESRITQIYLKCNQGETRRVRRREYSDRTVFTETVKRRIDSISALEIENEITESEFLEKAKDVEENSKPVVKTRHTFVYLGNTFEVDVYPEWKSTCILETELASREISLTPPAFITVIREVTGMREYSNYSLSKKFPTEDHL